MKVRRILFPTDFSDTADQALSHALFLAEQYGAVLHLLHAVVLHEYDPNDPDHHFPDAKELLTRMFEIADSEMARLLEQRQVEALEIKEEKRKGFSAAEVILEYAAEIEADLLVMGTHGRRGAARLLLGSVAEEVVRRAECPVMTLRKRESPRSLETIEKILVPIDFSDHSRLALRHAESLAERYEAGLELLFVVEVPTYPYFYTPPEDEYIEARAARASQALNDLAAEELSTAVPCATFVRSGKAAREIVDFAAEESIDLVVIATHGLGGVERLLIGSTAEEVVRRVDCPVLTVKAFGKSLL